mmetsp:Transcript_6680/g.17163  ORF Transcript_6680/g.17163 Transcript_6680/m.17163 type:complete len:200 (+) Transcript_6680:702-1301(+)
MDSNLFLCSGGAQTRRPSRTCTHVSIPAYGGGGGAGGKYQQQDDDDEGESDGYFCGGAYCTAVVSCGGINLGGIPPFGGIGHSEFSKACLDLMMRELPKKARRHRTSKRITAILYPLKWIHHSAKFFLEYSKPASLLLLVPWPQFDAGSNILERGRGSQEPIQRYSYINLLSGGSLWPQLRRVVFGLHSVLLSIECRSL